MSVGLKITPVLSLLLLLSLNGCASKAVEVANTCAQLDWYELGRRDGAEGVPNERSRKQQKECGANFTPELETMYTNGRNAGLVEYCDPKNAYEMGRGGVAYYYVCPSTVEPQFLGSYRKGQNIRALEVQNERLDEQIVELGQKLAQGGDDQQDIEEQLQDLKSKRNQNSKQLTKIISN